MGRSNLNDQVRSTFCVLRRRLFSLPSPRSINLIERSCPSTNR
jgi:hypothetical protein